MVYNQEKWKHVWSQNMYMNVQSSIIHSSPKEEKNLNLYQLDKQNVEQPYDRMLFSNKKE